MKTNLFANINYLFLFFEKDKKCGTAQTVQYRIKIYPKLSFLS